MFVAGFVIAIWYMDTGGIPEVAVIPSIAECALPISFSLDDGYPASSSQAFLSFLCVWERRYPSLERMASSLLFHPLEQEIGPGIVWGQFLFVVGFLAIPSNVNIIYYVILAGCCRRG